MIKNVTKLEVKKEEKVFQFECDNSAQLGEVYDVLAEMLRYVAQRIQESIPQKPQAEAQPEVCAVEQPQ